MRRYLPTPYLDGPAWVALWQTEIRTPGTLRLWNLGRVHALALAIERGLAVGPITVVGRVIVDGNYRAAAARALGVGLVDIGVEIGLNFGR